MNRFFFILISGILFFNSCKEEQPPIAPEKMAQILADLHMAESFAQLLPIDEGGYMNKNYDTMMVLYSNIYAQNNLDTISFKEAITWYESHPKIFDGVYEQVLETLSIRKESRVDSTSKKDSVTIIDYSDSTNSTMPDTL